MARRPFTGPVVITTEYGTPQAGTRRGYHTGVDYGLALGTPIVAPSNGVIVRNGNGTSSTDGRGYFIVFRGDDGIYHQLFHLRAMGTVTGWVAEGTQLGSSGNTGFSTGPHLHWETTRADDRVSDFSPGQWLFAGRPVYIPPAPVAQKDYIRIFGDYRTLWSSPGGGWRKAVLAPSIWPGGHLDYQILERSGVYVRIQTSFFGQGWLYVGSDVSHLTQYYKA